MESNYCLLVKRNGATKFALLIDGDVLFENCDAQTIAAHVATETGFQLDVHRYAGDKHDDVWSYAYKEETEAVLADARVFDGEVFAEE